MTGSAWVGGVAHGADVMAGGADVTVLGRRGRHGGRRSRDRGCDVRFFLAGGGADIIIGFGALEVMQWLGLARLPLGLSEDPDLGAEGER